MLTSHNRLCYLLLTTLIIFTAYNLFAAGSPTQTSSAKSPLNFSQEYMSQAAGPKGKGKLIFAHVIFRHGDRMPIEPYPTDPNKNPEDWPTGWGQLTNIGKQQHQLLGQWIRNRYSTLLNRKYSNDEIYVRSTDVDRTLMSALSHLAGLYPPVDGQIWNKDIAWQPIPVHTVPENQDKILAAKVHCPAYDYAYSALMQSPEFQEINARYEYLYNYLTKYTGRTVDTLEAIQRINNTLFIESLYNKTLPDWTKKVFPSPDMTFVSDLTFATATYTRQLARLKVGLLIKEILQRFKEKAQGKLKPDRSVWIYSAHDTTVANVLNALKVFEVKSPPYTACILLELRIDDKQNPLVSVFYKNSSDEPQPLHIPGCGTACPLNKMYFLYKDILPTDWESECSLSNIMMNYEEANVGTAMGILLAMMIVMMFLTYIGTVVYRRRNYGTYTAYARVA